MWPDQVIRQFNSTEKEYNAIYNKILHILFPVNSDFIVVPRFIPDPRNLADANPMFEIFLLDKPVLILDLNSPRHLSLPSKRQMADNRIRSRMLDVVDTCPLKTLYGVSAMGTKLCFYSLETKPKGEIDPELILPDPTKRIDTAPPSRWNSDILEPIGEEKLRQIAEEIMNGHAALKG